VYRRVDKLAINLLTFGRSHSTGRPFFILHTMKIEKVFVSPEFAKSLLAKNLKNRRMTESIARRYADEIRNGRWKEDTYEPIKISESGVILDGQHRLSAVVKSGIGVYFHIATGLKDDIFDVIDTGKKRTGGDTLSSLGVKNYNVIAGALNLVFLIEEDIRSRRFSANNEILLRYEKEPELWDEFATNSLTLCRHISRALAPSWIAAFLYVFSKVDKVEACEFMDQLCTGKDVKNGTILVLRKKLIDAKMSNAIKMNPELKYALVVKTWNAFRDGREYSLLRYKPIEDDFPMPR